ncbi:MAG: WG repeat-containing protein [Bacteroidia bacterium]|nr:WG repeat-containing protein [Bacteroidia bacterium]
MEFTVLQLDFQKDRCLDAAFYLGNNLFKVRKNGKLGIMNLSGKIILPCLYDSISEFDPKTQLAEVQLGLKKAKVNTLGKLVSPLK